MAEGIDSNQETLRRFAEAMPQMAFIADAKGDILFYNKRHYDYFGASPTEHAGWGWRDNKPAVHPEDLDRTVATWTKALETGAVYEIEYRLRRHDGQYRWHLGRAVPERASDGTITAWYGTNTDINDARTARERIDENQARFQFAMEAVQMGTWTVDLKTSGVDLSPQARKIFGLSDDPRDVNQTIDAAIHPDDRAFARTDLEKAIASRSLYKSEYRVVRSVDGAVRWILSTGRARYDDQGVPTTLTGVVIDLTENRLAEQRVRESEKRYEMATRATRDAIWDWNLRTNEVLWNEAIHSVLEHPLAAMKSDANWWYENIHPDDRERVVHGIHEVIESKDGQRWSDEYRYARGDGSFAIVLDRGFVQREADGTPTRMIGAMEDISQRKILEHDLIDAKEAAERANEAKSAFLANMSHEIRTPLGAIMGFSDLARQPGATKEEVASYLGIVEKNSVQVLRIIDDILDLAKVEAGRMTVESVEVSLTELLADFSSLTGFRARESGIEFKVIAETDLPDRICTDPTRLRQILTNAVSNAIKFTSRGSVTLHVCHHGGSLDFKIEDTGRGISQEQASKLFQAFVQADSSTTRKFGGTGLGLVLTKNLCRLLGGDYVLARSELGKGSTFIASIRPDVPAHAKILPKDSIEFQSTHAQPSKDVRLRLRDVKVLLVEDSPDNQTLVTLILEKQGAKITVANDGVQGVEKAMAGDFDVVLMDIQMPNMDGHEATRTLRSKGFSRPIVALTAHAMREEAERAAKSGFTTFLSKPIQRESLISTVQTLSR